MLCSFDLMNEMMIFHISMNSKGAMSTKIMKHLNVSTIIEVLIILCGVFTNFFKLVTSDAYSNSRMILNSKKNLPMFVKKLFKDTSPNSLSNGTFAGNHEGLTKSIICIRSFRIFHKFITCLLISVFYSCDY